MKLTYDVYTTYGGTLDEIEFSRYEYKAEAELDNRTFYRIQSTDERVQRCLFELVNFFAGQNGVQQEITSVSNDGYSVSYGTEKSVSEIIDDIIYTYFVGTDMLYAGAVQNVQTYTPIADDGYEFLQVLKDD